jgi:hypothetical protein
MSVQRCRSAAVVAAMLFTWIMPANAGPLSPPEASVGLKALDETQEEIGPPSIIRDLDATSVGPNYTVIAETSVESLVSQQVIAKADIQAIPNMPTTLQTGGTAQASASLRYFGRLNRIQTPPNSTTPITYDVRMRGYAKASALPLVLSGNGGAGASYTAVVEGLSGVFFITKSVATSTGPPIASDDVIFEFTIDQSSLPRDFTISLSCNASVSAFSLGGTSDAEAMADPVFTFDQARFDQLAAQQGLSSFPLDQYFGFDFSPGIVPEPPAAALALCAAAMLFVLPHGRRNRL